MNKDKQLPEGWRMVKFGDMAKHISKRVEPSETDLNIYVGLEHLDPDSLRIKRHGVPSDVEGQKLLVKKGQIIFGKRRAYQRKLGVAEWDCICSAHAMVLEANPATVLPEFLPFFMQSDVFMNRAVSISEGSLSPTIKWKTLANQNFEIPSFEIQNKIVTVLSVANNAKERVFDTQQSLSALINGFEINKMLTDDECNLKNIGECSIILIDGDRGKEYPKTSEFSSSGFCLFLSAKNVTQNGFVFDETQFISKERDSLLRKGKLQRGDIILTTRGTVGNVAIYDDFVGYSDIRINSGMLILRNMDSKILSEYLFLVLTSKWMKQKIHCLAFGSAQPQLTVQVLLKLEIPVLPLNKQKEICQTLLKMRNILDSLNNKEKAINSITMNMFKSS